MNDAKTFVASLEKSFSALLDPEVAQGQWAYMRNQFAFLGIKTDPRREALKTVHAHFPITTTTELSSVVSSLWALPYREYHYSAVDLLVKHKKLVTPEMLPLIVELITTNSWWDTVDKTASDVVGPLVLRHPEMVGVVDGWLWHGNLWLRRTSIIHQLQYKDKTDQAFAASSSGSQDNNS